MINKAKLKDIFEFVRHRKLSQLKHAMLISLSYYLSRLMRRPIVWGMPLAVSIEPTTSCNLRCPECPSGLRSFTRDRGMSEDELVHRVIDNLKSSLTTILFYFQGEPYLNSGFLRQVKIASKAGIYTSTSTNAHYLHPKNAKATVESGLSRLIISIDGTSQATYEQYRIGGSLQKVIEGTKNLIEAKKALNSSTPYVVFQFLVVRPNEHQVGEVYRLADELGVDEVKLKTAQIYDYEHGSDLIPENEKYSRYRKLADGRYEFKNKLLNQCWKMWHSCVFTWDGNTVPCCFDKDAHHQMGNIMHQPFEKIWKNEAYQNFRSLLLNGREEIDICKNCTEGTKIWAED
ncbi:MAG: SPASM domain-containing protein [Cyclobacteriaceae bacterium]|nr:SPASM domain-containing protein [Cyclobacteriaceae bacterium]MCH8515230.1 SPASM domain-containing protein [Cyclobacteriaceae bacterium]